MAELPPRNPKALLAEMDARMRARDIREWERLKRQVAQRWWEPTLRLLLFVSGLGCTVTLVHMLRTFDTGYESFILLWGGLLIVAVLASVELVILRMHALRKLHEETTRRLEEQEQTLKAIRDYLEAVDESLHPGG
jgi:hypothetical protein